MAEPRTFASRVSIGTPLGHHGARDLMAPANRDPARRDVSDNTLHRPSCARPSITPRLAYGVKVIPDRMQLHARKIPKVGFHYIFGSRVQFGNSRPRRSLGWPRQRGLANSRRTAARARGRYNLGFAYP